MNANRSAGSCCLPKAALILARSDAWCFIPWFEIPAPECSLIAASNLTALSVGDALFLSKSCRPESPSLLLIFDDGLY
jgi:hypothetical protein